MATYTSNTSVSIPANARNITITVAGARGGTGGIDAGAPGGPGGGGRVGTFTLPNNTARTLTFTMGTSGGNGVSSASSAAGGPPGGGIASGGRGGFAGPQGSSGGGGGGGGATGVYDSLSNSYIIVAGGGGGGGGASYPNVPGLNGLDGSNWTSSVSPLANGQNGQNCPTDGGAGGGGGGGSGSGGILGAGGPNGYDVSTGNLRASGGGGGGSGYNSSYVTFSSSSSNSGNGYVELSYDLVSPTISTFTANPTAIISGNTTRLSWTTTDTTSASIDQGVGIVALNGFVDVSPATTRTYTLTVGGLGNTSNTAQVTVTVYQPPILTLTLDRSSIAAGESTTLRWTTTGDASSISWTSGNITNTNLNSFSSVAPTQTTTYSATVSGLGGTDSDSITLTVHQIPTASISAPQSLNYGTQGTISYASSYSNTSLYVKPTYTYTNGTTTAGTDVVLPTATSTQLNAVGSSVSGTFNTDIPYNTIGPVTATYVIYAQGSGGTASASSSTTINIDQTPNNIIIPETENVFKSQDPVITPDAVVTSQTIEIQDIDIPVEIKSDRPIQVNKNLSEIWQNLRQI